MSCCKHLLMKEVEILTPTWADSYGMTLTLALIEYLFSQTENYWTQAAYKQ